MAPARLTRELCNKYGAESGPATGAKRNGTKPLERGGRGRGACFKGPVSAILRCCVLHPGDIQLSVGPGFEPASIVLGSPRFNLFQRPSALRAGAARLPRERNRAQD